MGQEWILDVLADIRRFAVNNRMPQLAEQLDDALMVATTEMASNANSAGQELGLASVTNAEQTGSVYRSVAAGVDA